MLLKIVLATGLCVLPSLAFAQTADTPITTRVDAEEGEYLVDGDGMSLYLFKADTQGIGSAARSACLDDCLGLWPPFVPEGAPIGDGKIKGDLLGTIIREDGIEQVTYNGWPLYYYAEDISAGEIKGHDLESFGEDWYLIGPNGERARE